MNDEDFTPEEDKLDWADDGPGPQAYEDDFLQFDYLHVRAPEFDVRPRPRLEGDDRRRPDVATTGFQSAVARSFVDKPEEPFDAAVITVDVPGGDALSAAATLKAVIDATVDAGVLRNDRSAVLAARLRKHWKYPQTLPVTSVEVVPHHKGDKYFGSFIRTPEQTDRRIVARSVIEPVAYSFRSGVPGAATFQNPWVVDPQEYESQLRSRWRRLVEARRIIVEPDDWAPLLLTGSLSVHLPKKYTEDGDNALLYIVDMLEVARRDVLGHDAGSPTLDQLLVEVSFQRKLDSGIRFWLSPVEQADECTTYYIDGDDWSGPYDADLIE